MSRVEDATDVARLDCNHLPRARVCTGLLLYAF